MAIKIPTLKFTKLDIKDIVATAWSAAEPAVDKAPTEAARSAAVKAALKGAFAAVISNMTVYEKEEGLYLDTVQALHAACKTEAQDAIKLLDACKMLKPADPNRTKLFEQSILRLRLSASEVEKAATAVSDWRVELVAHQGVRGGMTVPASMKAAVEEKFLTGLEEQYKKMREPLITRMVKEGDSVVKIKQFKERIDDCLKTVASLGKATGQDAAELNASWNEIKQLARSWRDNVKFPQVAFLDSSYKTLMKNDPKDKAAIKLLADKSEPAWVAQLKGAKSYVKTLRIKTDNFVAANKDVAKHPVMGKELATVNREMGDIQKELDASQALVEKCQKRMKALKL